MFNNHVPVFLPVPDAILSRSDIFHRREWYDIAGTGKMENSIMVFRREKEEKKGDPCSMIHATIQNLSQ